MIEERTEMMVSSLTIGNTIIRKASFLKPFVPLQTNDPLSHLPTYSFPSLPPNFDPKEWSLDVSFLGWVTWGHEAWNSWVDGMALKHQDLWKSVGIYEPIMSSNTTLNETLDWFLG